MEEKDYENELMDLENEGKNGELLSLQPYELSANSDHLWCYVE